MYVQAVLKDWKLCKIYGIMSGLPEMPELWLCHLDWGGHKHHCHVHVGLTAAVSAPTLYPLRSLKLLVLLLAQVPPLSPHASSVPFPRQAFIPLGLYCLLSLTQQPFFLSPSTLQFLKESWSNITIWSISWLLALYPEFHVLVSPTLLPLPFNLSKL